MLTNLKHTISSVLIHQGFRRYFANTSWMFAEQILRLIAGLLVGIWVARYLGPGQFGVFSYAIAFAAIFSAIAKLGLDGIVVRDLVREPSRRDVYLGSAFWLKLVGAIVTLVVIAISTQLFSNDRTTNLYILIIASGTIFQSFEVVDFYFQSQVLSKFVSICKLMQLVLSSLLKLYLIFTEADLFWFVLVSLIDQMILGLSLYLAYRYQKLGGFYSHFDLTTAKQLLQNSWPLIFSGLVIMIYMRIDQIMIKEMLGEKAVGLYSAATRISEAWYFIPMLLTNSLFPSIVNAKKVSETLYLARLQRLYTFLLWMGVAVALPMTFMSNWLITLLYGEAYNDAGQVLMIHIWAGIFVSLGVASGSWYTSENLQRYAFYRTLLGAIINVALNLVLIPDFGLIGAAIATVISYMVAGLLFDLLTVRTRKMFFMKINAIFFKGVKVGS
ncbi:MAG: flippase [Methylobacter sp.]|uniref:flippase n=1 Tax=Methylobacter sp. TaxID=2051955 RepID=UPI002723B530|nr:flippase [Methylobacter sp.]MDO9268638.1 flippase [Methylobacter sp.]MDP1666471.1 flippase [Methylobacter sp.]